MAEDKPKTPEELLQEIHEENLKAYEELARDGENSNGSPIGAALDEFDDESSFDK